MVFSNAWNGEPAHRTRAPDAWSCATALANRARWPTPMRAENGLGDRRSEALAKNGFLDLERFGIVRSAIRKDLLFFFLPWLTVFYLELLLCENYGDGVSGIWGIIWELVKQPQNLFMLPLQRIMGLALFVVGLTIMIVGQATLWRDYSGFLIIRKDHRLITHGIYRFTRNPIYLGAIMVFTGLPVYAASLYGFLAALVQIPIFLNRIRLEEQLLAEEFQNAYQEYKETTRRLIPFIY